MTYYGYEFIRESDLAHHGIKGQKWGVRRFQNEDGTWTATGRKRYSSEELRTAAKQVQEYNAGKLKNQQQMSTEKRQADAKYDREGRKLRAAQAKIAPKDYDKAWDKLGKDLDRAHNEADKRQAEHDKRLASDLKKKYGIDVNESLKAINQNPLKTALALAGKGKASNVVSSHGDRALNQIKSRALDGDGLTSQGSRRTRVIH